MAARRAARSRFVGLPFGFPQTIHPPWRSRVGPGLCHGKTGINGKRRSSVGMIVCPCPFQERQRGPAAIPTLLRRRARNRGRSKREHLIRALTQQGFFAVCQLTINQSQRKDRWANNGGCLVLVVLAVRDCLRTYA